VRRTFWAEEPASFEQVLARADALYAAGRYDEAIRDYKKANKLKNNQSSEALLGLATTYDKLRANKNVVESCEGRCAVRA